MYDCPEVCPFYYVIGSLHRPKQQQSSSQREVLFSNLHGDGKRVSKVDFLFVSATRAPIPDLRRLWNVPSPGVREVHGLRRLLDFQSTNVLVPELLLRAVKKT
jgi:hypothetical protein